MADMAIMARRRLFSSAHFYNQESFSEEENRKTFGRCYTKYGHGHNYVLEAFVEGPIDPNTNLIINLNEIESLLKTVTDPLDHQHLNFDVPHFRQKIPTTENIALYLREQLLEQMAQQYPFLRLNRIRLWETDDLWVEVLG